jgi:hypothetical protein
MGESSPLGVHNRQRGDGGAQRLLRCGRHAGAAVEVEGGEGGEVGYAPRH